MAIKLVSDVHGAHEALASQLSPNDTLVMLGDYANLIEFETLDGIVSDIITKPRLMRVLGQVAAGDWDEAKELVAGFTLPDGKYYGRVTDLLSQDYRLLFDSIPCETFAAFGNNDYPDLLAECAGANVRIVNGEAVEIERRRFGFVSGSPPHRLSLGLPGDMDESTYSANVATLGRVEILCSHVPPSGMDLEYDAVAARDEASSEALADYIKTYQPQFAFHGHVHNPATETAMSGTTRIKNLGYFKRHQRVFTLGDG